jgi:carbon-monoxide dehydrogenase medium subunit
MYPPKFDYYRASSVDEAISLAQTHQGKFLAGGHSLIPLMNMRLADPGAVIDIGRIAGLKGISVSGSTVRIGALTTHSMVAASSDVPTVLSEAAGMIGDPQVRNRGTVGGNISHADPASDLPTVFLALGATMHIQGPGGSRTVSADDFFLGLFETAVGENELLVAVEVSAANGSGSGYAKMFNPASRYAMLGAAAVLSASNGVCSSASVAVGGLTPKATKANAVGNALVGQPLNADTIAAAAAMVSNDLGSDILNDIHASADYRREMAPVYVRRALTKAAERA